jgi:flagellar hook-associated protein 2
MVSTINLSTLGVGSGINDASIISQYVAIQQQPLTAMQTEQSLVQSASQSISSFSSLLSALQAAAQSLSDPTQYASTTATSSDPAIAASAAPGAQPGRYQVQVQQLAQAQVSYGDPQSSSTSALGMAGTLGITVAGQTVEVPVATGDSLATIASNISSSGAPVSASVVFDGTNYRLQVQGLATGSTNAIAFDESGFSLGLSDPANTYSSAQDAIATVNDIAVTSPTNQISGAIPGVTLAVTSTMSSPTTVTVASNPSAIVSSVASFVSAYNAVVSAGHADAGYGSTAATNSMLAGDRAIGTSLDRLSSLVASNVPGADSTFQSLASVGVTLNNDGSLSLNQSQLSSAIESDPSGVERLFVTSTSNGSTGIMGTMATAITALTNSATSPVKSEINSLDAKNRTLTTEEAAMQARITQYQNQLQAEYSNMEQTVQSDKTLFSDLGGTGTFV